MKIMLMKPGPYEAANLEEFFQGLHTELITAHDPRSLSKALLDGDTDILLYNVSSIEDFALIRYVNIHHPDVRVIVLTENGMGSAIENVRQGSFGSLRKPYHLEELSDYITANSGVKHL